MSVVIPPQPQTPSRVPNMILRGMKIYKSTTYALDSVRFI